MLPKFFTGWLWGSARYATGMITLLLPVHFIFNAASAGNSQVALRHK